jgi:hypothetical protein
MDLYVRCTHTRRPRVPSPDVSQVAVLRLGKQTNRLLNHFANSLKPRYGHLYNQIVSVLQKMIEVRRYVALLKIHLGNRKGLSSIVYIIIRKATLQGVFLGSRNKIKA